MNTYTQTTEMTATKIKTQAKADLTELIMSLLGNELGEESVKMIRTGNPGSEKNTVGVNFGNVLTSNGEKPITLSIEISAKPYTDSPASAKRPYSAFDFLGAAQRYENYLAEKITKATDAAATKKANIAKDEARRKAITTTPKEDIDF